MRRTAIGAAGGSLIITGDDFGLAVPVNEAIEIAHREGILSTTSLMVGGPAAADAVARARGLPTLRVGLHLALVEERPLLAREEIPQLVGAEGRLHGDLVRSGFRFFFLPDIRRQMEAEVQAQFEAFARTGLPLDHVNAHNHMHLHPTLLGIVLRVGRHFGLRAMRVPYEPPVRSWRAAGRGLTGRLFASVGLLPWTRLLRARLRRAGIVANDFVFGMADSGKLDESLVLRFLAHVPPHGVTELYFHPATRHCAEIDRNMATYRHEDELAALISPRTRAAIQQRGLQLTTYSDLARTRN